MPKNPFCRTLIIKIQIPTILTNLNQLGLWQRGRINIGLFPLQKPHSCLWIRRFISYNKQVWLEAVSILITTDRPAYHPNNIIEISKLIFQVLKQINQDQVQVQDPKLEIIKVLTSNKMYKLRVKQFMVESLNEYL